jgi:hypothetical protein
LTDESEPYKNLRDECATPAEASALKEGLLTERCATL